MKEMDGPNNKGEHPNDDLERAKFFRREIKTKMASLDALPEKEKPTDTINTYESMDNIIAAIQKGEPVPEKDAKILQKMPKPEEKESSIGTILREELDLISWKAKALGAGGGIGAGIIDITHGNYGGAIARGIIGAGSAAWLAHEKIKEHKKKKEDESTDETNTEE